MQAHLRVHLVTSGYWLLVINILPENQCTQLYKTLFPFLLMGMWYCSLMQTFSTGLKNAFVCWQVHIRIVSVCDWFFFRNVNWMFLKHLKLTYWVYYQCIYDSILLWRVCNINFIHSIRLYLYAQFHYAFFYISMKDSTCFIKTY